jgi:uncharacterized protein
MRWDDFRQSGNVEDRRGQGGGGGFHLPIGRGGIGIGTVVVLFLIGWATGIDPMILLGGADMVAGNRPEAVQPAARGPVQDQAGRFVSAVLAQTEDVWKRELPRQAKIAYREPGLVLFSGATQSGCGFARAQMGPFYCPGDQKVYIDLEFFAQMQQRLGAKGDFAFAYVIAHEVGHHVENQLGILDKAQGAQRGAGGNAASVRVELMADCLAGVWAYHAQQNWSVLEEGDIEEAMNAAASVGDDRLQRAQQGYVVPDSFTHGSSAQRVRWFSTGLKSGSVNSCNTFAAQAP